MLQQAISDLATQFAVAWAHAADEQNLRDRAAWIDQQKSNRSFLDSAGKWLFGDDIDATTPTPPPTPIPTGPDFLPTINLSAHWEPY